MVKQTLHNLKIIYKYGKDFKKSLISRFNEIYAECGNNYIKWVERMEELEKAGKVKTEWLKRDNIKTIWDK